MTESPVAPLAPQRRRAGAGHRARGSHSGGRETRQQATREAVKAVSAVKKVERRVVAKVKAAGRGVLQRCSSRREKGREPPPRRRSPRRVRSGSRSRSAERWWRPRSSPRTSATRPPHVQPASVRHRGVGLAVGVRRGGRGGLWAGFTTLPQGSYQGEKLESAGAARLSTKGFRVLNANSARLLDLFAPGHQLTVPVPCSIQPVSVLGIPALPDWRRPILAQRVAPARRAAASTGAVRLRGRLRRRAQPHHHVQATFSSRPRAPTWLRRG